MVIQDSEFRIPRENNKNSSVFRDQRKTNYLKVPGSRSLFPEQISSNIKESFSLLRVYIPPDIMGENRKTIKNSSPGVA